MAQAETKAKVLKIGILGFGSMGKTHAFAVQSLPYYYDLPFSAEVAAVTCRSEDKAKSVADTFHIPHFAVNEDELILSPDIDVIDICTPNICHKETILKAMRAGKHILCEKPLASSQAEAKEIMQAAEDYAKTGKIAGVVFNNRNHASILRAKQLIEEGRLGKILSFRADYLHNSCLDPEKKAGWKQDGSVCGKGGVLFDLGSHVLDLVYYLCGEFRSVQSLSQIAFPERKGMNGAQWSTDASEAFYLLLELQNGAMGTVTASKLTTGANDDLSIEVYGTKGSLKFSLMNPNYLYFYDSTAQKSPIGGLAGYTAIECVGRYPEPGGIFPSVKASNGWLRGHIHGMYRFLDAVYRAGALPAGTQIGEGFFSPSLRDGAYIQSVMDAALSSAESGLRTNID